MNELCFSFCLCGKLFLQFQRTILLSQIAFLGSFSLSALWIYCAVPFGPEKLHLKNLRIVVWGFPCTYQVVFLLLLKRFSQIKFDYLFIMCVSVGSLDSSYLKVSGLPGSGCLFPLLRLGEFPAVISLNWLSGFVCSLILGPL